MRRTSANTRERCWWEQESNLQSTDYWQIQSSDPDIPFPPWFDLSLAMLQVLFASFDLSNVRYNHALFSQAVNPVEDNASCWKTPCSAP